MTTTLALSWRNSPNIAIHPGAEGFPLLAGDELAALAKDIKENRLREKVTVINKGSKQLVIDGRNRLDALELAGFPIVDPATDRLVKAVYIDIAKNVDLDLVEPAKIEAFIVSKNILRRHLTQDQKRDLLEKLLKAQPERSDRAIAKIANVHNETVASVRQNLEASAEICPTHNTVHPICPDCGKRHEPLPSETRRLRDEISWIELDLDAVKQSEPPTLALAQAVVKALAIEDFKAFKLWFREYIGVSVQKPKLGP
jgi:hypothetical protein